jgi:hypothetical protein
MLKTLNQFKSDIFETFLPYEGSLKDIDWTNHDSLLTKGVDKPYLENEDILVFCDNKYYLLKGSDFTSFRIDALNDRLFTLADGRLFESLDKAIAHVESQPNEVSIITFNIFQDCDGDYTDMTFYTNILEG